jgi:ABC-type histidine transport system ATPase subunit
MDEGIVAEYGTPEEVFDNPSSERTKRFIEGYSTK